MAMTSFHDCYFNPTRETSKSRLCMGAGATRMTIILKISNDKGGRMMEVVAMTSCYPQHLKKTKYYYYY